MKRKLLLNTIFKALKILLIIIFWIMVWQIAVWIVDLPLLFPSPLDVMSKLKELLIDKSFYLATLSSFGRILFGIIIGVFLGALMALVCSFSKIINDFFLPFVSIVKSTPIVAFVFLVNIFIGNEKTVVVICALMVFPIIFANVFQGIKSIDKDLSELCKVYKIPFAKKLIVLYLPTVMPYFISALLSAVGLAWKAGIAAEVLCTPKISIGIEIFNSKQYIEYIDLFAWTFTVVILSLIFEFVITKILKILSRKYFSRLEDTNEN